MRIFNHATADTYMVSDIAVARWEQYALGKALPFGGMWYTVPPGSNSPADCHPEVELSFVVSGSGVVEAGGLLVDVGVGSAFLLDGGETHKVHNRSADRPFVVFSAYWMPADAPADAPADVKEAVGA
ncbi:MAG TPA: cupin domain-containing protein [Actinomycetota bacterium]|nr:cupin domain-containing protein [Actinomycetota bacterium]